jgi:hypothetical protein
MYLTDHLFRDAMLKNGLDALLAGYDSENIVLLSCASTESDSDLVETFISAAYELNIKLPGSDENGLWVADTYLELLELGVELPPIDVQTEFMRYLLVIYNELAKIAKYDQSLHKFNFEFGKFLEVTGYMNEYVDWIDFLFKLTSEIENSKYRQFANESSTLITDVAYGATTHAHVLGAHEIAMVLKKHNEHK